MCMPANYLRVITLSIIIWVIQQSSYLWTNVMPQSLYYDRILTMTSWKINHLEGPLQGLKKIRKQVRNEIKCRNKPYLKSCEKFELTFQQKSFLEQHLLNYPPPKMWIHWSSSEKIDNQLKLLSNAEIDEYLDENSHFHQDITHPLLRMHLLSEKLARNLKQKYSTVSFNQFNNIPWWYFLILFLLVLLNISLCNVGCSTADIENER